MGGKTHLNHIENAAHTTGSIDANEKNSKKEHISHNNEQNTRTAQPGSGTSPVLGPWPRVPIGACFGNLLCRLLGPSLGEFISWRPGLGPPCFVFASGFHATQLACEIM